MSEFYISCAKLYKKIVDIMYYKESVYKNYVTAKLHEWENVYVSVINCVIFVLAASINLHIFLQCNMLIICQLSANLSFFKSGVCVCVCKIFFSFRDISFEVI